MRAACSSSWRRSAAAAASQSSPISTRRITTVADTTTTTTTTTTSMCGPFPVRMLAPTLMRFSMGNDTRAALAWTAAASSPLLIHAHAFSSGGGKKRDDDDVDDCFVPPSRGGETETSKDNNGAAETGSSVEELRAAHNPPSLRTAYSPSGIDLPESSFLKCIEKEITDEKLRLDKEDGPPPPPPGWELSHTKGSSVFYGRRMWMPPPTPGGGFSGDRAAEEDAEEDAAAGGSFPPRHQRCVEKHFIRVQLTTRDASLDPECDIRGEHFPFSFFVQRVPLSSSSSSSSASSATAEAHVQRNPIHAPTFDDDEALSVFENSIEVRLDVVDGELVVDNVVYHGDHELLSPLNKTKLKPTLKTDDNDADNDPFCNSKTHRVGLQERHGKNSGGGDGAAVVEYNSVFGGYPGPNLDEAEEDVLDGIQSWLAERAVDDGFGEFIGQYSVWVEQAEYEQWLQQLYDYIAA